MLMWLSRFQLSSPRCRPSPSPTPQVFSVHPTLFLLLLLLLLMLWLDHYLFFFCFMWLLVYEPSKPLMWIYRSVLKLETTSRFFFFVFFFGRTVWNFNFTEQAFHLVTKRMCLLLYIVIIQIQLIISPRLLLLMLKFKY